MYFQAGQVAESLIQNPGQSKVFHKKSYTLYII